MSRRIQAARTRAAHRRARHRRLLALRAEMERYRADSAHDDRLDALAHGGFVGRGGDLPLVGEVTGEQVRSLRFGPGKLYTTLDGAQHLVGGVARVEVYLGRPCPPQLAEAVRKGAEEAQARAGEPGTCSCQPLPEGCELREMARPMNFSGEPASGCGRRLAPGQWWGYCGETDMGHTLPALCRECGGDLELQR